MNEYERLRDRAKLKRDKAIEKARAEYRQSVKKINELERKLGGNSRKASTDKLKPINELICDVLPRDRLFTIHEVIDLVQQAEPDRVLNVQTIRTIFTLLSVKDIVRRVRRGERHSVLWVVSEHPEAAGPFGAANLTEVSQKMLGESGPMRPAELVVAIKATGYRPHASPRTLMSCVLSMFQRNPDKFVRDKAGRWTLYEC